MTRVIRYLIVLVIALAALPVTSTAANSPTWNAPTVPPICPNALGDPGSGGARYQVCMPLVGPWNHDLVIFAHGYVDPALPIGMPYDQLNLPDGTNLPGLVTSLGYAFAVSSYTKNGLAVLQGVDDSAALVQLFKSSHPDTVHVYLVGVSEGGLVTTLSLEQKPNLYSGGVAACGPIGDFRAQVNYFGDFRDLFGYFYPNTLPGSAITSLPEPFTSWYATSRNQVGALIAIPANAPATSQLLRTSSAPIDPSNPGTAVATVVGILDYSVRATDDARATLHGQPYGNRGKWYVGSANDLLLNRTIPRFSADPTALAEIAARYQTTGKLSRPLVALHTTGDPIVPFWHEGVYRIKTLITGSLFRFINIPVNRYGHCNFKASEALAAFSLMVLQVTGKLPANAVSALPNAYAQTDFNRIVKENTVTK